MMDNVNTDNWAEFLLKLLAGTWQYFYFMSYKAYKTEFTGTRRFAGLLEMNNEVGSHKVDIYKVILRAHKATFKELNVEYGNR